MTNIGTDVELELMKNVVKRYSDDPENPDTVKDDLRQAGEINLVQISVKNCICCLKKIRWLKVVIRKSIKISGNVFDTQKFLKKYTVIISKNIMI
jgi:hypothetical protein